MARMAPAHQRRRKGARNRAPAGTRAGRRRLTPAHLLQDAIRFPLCIPRGDRLTFVVSRFAACDRYLHLAASILEVDAERHQCDALFLGRPRQLRDLLVVKEELAPPDGVEVTA